MSLKDTISFWVLDMQHGHRYYLDWSEGQSLQLMLDNRIEASDRLAEKKDQWEPQFVKITDVTGSEITLRVDTIGELWCSTPAIRASEQDPDGALEAIRAIMRATSKKSWAVDPNEEEED